MKQKENITIIDTTFIDYDYADYVENCECNDVEPQDKDSQDFIDWCYEQREFKYEFGLEELAGLNGFNGEGTCVIEGSLGLWNGTHTIMPQICKSAKDAVLRCYGSCDDLKVILTPKGTLEVSAYHHDGTNHFTISKLNKKGISIVNLTEVKDYMICKYKFVA